MGGLSWSASFSRVSTATICCRALRCWVVDGFERWAAVAGLCLLLSRVDCQGKGCLRLAHRWRPLAAVRRLTCWVCAPTRVCLGRGFDLPRGVHRGLNHRVGRREPAPACGEISSCRPAEHRRRSRPVDGSAVFPSVTDLLRLSTGGWDIGVNSLAAQLVIDRCWAHGRHRRGGSGRVGVNMVCTGGDPLWMGAERWGIRPSRPTHVSNAYPGSGQLTTCSVSRCSHGNRGAHSSDVTYSRMGCNGRSHPPLHPVGVDVTDHLLCGRSSLTRRKPTSSAGSRWPPQL